MIVSKWNALYSFLLFLRIISALSPSYIHPDEWFQSGEAVIGHLLQVNTLKTWEFKPSFPCRSMASIYLFNLPLVIAAKFHLLDQSSSAFTFFLVQRFTFLFLSFVPDLCIAKYIGSNLLKRQKQIALLLYAGSGAVLSFTCRPFSNNVESTILCICFAIVSQLTFPGREVHARTKSSHSISHDKSNWTKASLFLGALGAAGFFSRFTFAIVAFPVVLQYLQVSQQRALLHTRPFLQWLQLLLPGLLGFFLTSASHVLIDSYFYSQSMEANMRESKGLYYFPIVPLNAFKYNLQSSNLAEHGIHPRWLHIVVNAPIIMGLIPYLSLLIRLPHILDFSKKRRSRDGSFNLEKLLVQIVAFSLIALSIQAHQEPRFLLPLIAPSSIFCGIHFGARKRGKVTKISFWTVFALQSIIMIFLFCITHQAGIVPSMLRFATLLKSKMREDRYEFFFWRTFMPPRHLLLPFLTSSIDETNVKDLASIPAQRALQIIKDSKEIPIIFNAPVWAVWQEKETFSQVNVTLENARLFQWPHLDLDHVSESLEMWHSGNSLWLSFSYASWYLKQQ